MRLEDSTGNFGPRSLAIKFKDDGNFSKVIANHPVIGCQMVVGTPIDYWQTTEIKEITKTRFDSNGKMIFCEFTTQNSHYRWGINTIIEINE